MNICLICLRADKLLKLASNVLKEFHDEMCDFSISMTSCYYCNECEYFITKFYEFKEKCAMALKVYKKWKSTKATKRKPLNLLHTLLPSSLADEEPSWTPDKIDKTQATEPPTDSHEMELRKNRLRTEVKLEIDHGYSNDINMDDRLKFENLSEDKPKSEDNNEIKDNSEAEHSSSETVEEPTRNRSGDERIDANISKCMNNVNNKQKNTVNSKKHKKTTDGEVENLPKRSKRASKKVASKRQAHNDKLIEEDKQYESLFDIKYLTTDEMQLEEFERRKTYACYVKADYKCDICYQVFKTENFLKYHTKKWHNESPGSIYCPICKIWSSKTSHHKVTHTVVFKCKLCPLVTYHRESMHNHFEWHNGKHYRCEECNITCKSKSAYRSHLGKEHRRGRNICESCGRGFLSPRGLTIHKHNSSRCTGNKEPSTVSQENKEGVRCDECDVTLPSQEIYDAHVYDVHEPRRRTFTTNSAGLPGYMKLSQKVRKVQQERRAVVKHTCRVCNADGVSFAWLQLHFKREHPNDDLDILYADKRTHLCDICGTGFGSAYGLRDHMNIHTGARPYACEMCPKRFRSAHLKRAHRVRHFPSTLACNICGKQFKTKGNLYWHMKIHTGEKNHKCDICGKGFLYSGNLEEHVRGVHYNLRRVKKGGTREAADTEGKRAIMGDGVTTEPEVDKFRSDDSE